MLLLYFKKIVSNSLFAPNYCGEFDNAGSMMSVDETLVCSSRFSIIFFVCTLWFVPYYIIIICSSGISKFKYRPTGCIFNHFMDTYENLTSRDRVVAWTMPEQCLNNIVGPTILFSIVSIIFVEQQACSWLLETGNICIDRATMLLTCLFQLVNKLLQYW